MPLQDVLKYLLSLNDRAFEVIRKKEFMLAFIVLVTYLSNPLVYTMRPDTLENKLVALSILREHDFDLDEFMTFNYKNMTLCSSAVNGVCHEDYSDNRGPRYLNGRVVSFYPILTPLLTVPFYLPLHILGIEDLEAYFTAAKVASSVFVTISVLLLYLAVKNLHSEKTALFVALIYAFGTFTWSFSSQDLWQHGVAEMFLAAGLYALVKGINDERYMSYSGFFLACLVATRPVNAVIFFIVFLYVAQRGYNPAKNFLLCSLPPFILMFSYSWVYFGSLLRFGQSQNPLTGWNTPLLDGLCGQLFGSSNGIITMTPVLTFSFLGMWLSRKNKPLNYLTIAAIVMILIWSKWWAWQGVMYFGNRMLLDITPILAFFLAPAYDKISKNTPLKLLFLFAVAYSVVVQLLVLFPIFNSAEGFLLYIS
ncbi:MAG: hypothetical protein V1703_00340 [Candidatus Altiarchaeota archaeon]